MMNENTARKVVWLAAIQEVAGARSSLPGRIPEAGAPAGDWDACFARVLERQPRLAEFDQSARLPGWIGWVLPGLALLSGLLAETLPASGRVDLVAVPVLSLILWNLAIYLWLVVGAQRAGVADVHAASGFRAWVTERCEAFLTVTGAADDPWQGVRRSFLHRWSNHVRALLRMRVQSVLHVAAAAAMLGLIAGMYLRGLGFEYRAGWSSTFLDGEALHVLLGAVLGPAVWVSGLELPTAGRLDQLAWSRNPAGENAARWIHLYAITAVMCVGLPRLVLALLAVRKAAALRANFPIDLVALGFGDAGRSALRELDNPRARRVCILPFNFELNAKDRELVRLYASGDAEGPVQLDVRERIDYAGIDDFLDGFTAAPGAYAHAVVFNLATTPEAEVQGVLLSGLLDRVDRLLVYLDGGAYAERFAAAPDFAGRLAGRRELWARFLETYALKPVFLRAEP